MAEVGGRGRRGRVGACLGLGLLLAARGLGAREPGSVEPGPVAAGETGAIALQAGSFTTVLDIHGGVTGIAAATGPVVAPAPPQPPTVLGRAARTPPAEARVAQAAADRASFALSYRARSTGLPQDVAVRREWTGQSPDAGSLTLEQRLEVTVATPIDRAFSWWEPVLLLGTPAATAGAWLPRRDGWGQQVALGGFGCAAYDLGGDVVAPGCTPLALPLIDLDLGNGWRAAVFSDPLFSTTFSLHATRLGTVLAATWRYPGNRVPFAAIERRLYLHLHRDGPEGAVDRLFAHTAVAGAPAWLEPIRLVYFDYLADQGEGWFRDLDCLAERIPEAERGDVAVALHGWYDRIGTYSYDHRRDRFRERWPAQPRRYGTRVVMDLDQVRHRLGYARQLGFRVLLYFADGLCLDSATERGAAYAGSLGRCPWNGPEVAGELKLQNPADPAVRQWFSRYLDALLRELGDHIDGLVWDETFWVKRTAVAALPEPALAGPALLSLTRALTAQAHAWRSDLAFLVSDNLTYQGAEPPPTALMADGTFQDSECDPAAWAPGLFPNWRKPLWSVLWNADSRFADMREGVLRFGAPVSLANGWADDLGPSEMPAERLDQAFALFAWLGGPGRWTRPAFLREDPADYRSRPLPSWP